jgi:hypothetical protein
MHVLLQRPASPYLWVRFRVHRVAYISGEYWYNDCKILRGFFADRTENIGAKANGIDCPITVVEEE